MTNLSKKQLSMSLFVLALNIIPLNIFAIDQFSEETEGELDNSSRVLINTETSTLNFADIFENGDNVGRNDTINILDVDFKDQPKFIFLNTILENKNNLVNLIITPNSPFLKNGALSIKKNLPFNLKHLSIKDNGNLVTKIGNDFLSLCTNLISFDSRGLENATKIGKYFLSNCYKLSFFDSRGLENVTKIGDLFLSNCESLISFYARGLENVTHIGDFFLYNCKLKEITTTTAKQWFWKENLHEEIKNSMIFLIQNEDQYNDIEERVGYVKEHYAQEIGGLTFLTPWRIKIETNSLLLL